MEHTISQQKFSNTKIGNINEQVIISKIYKSRSICDYNMNNLYDQVTTSFHIVLQRQD